MTLAGTITWGEILTIVLPVVSTAIGIYGWANGQIGSLRKELTSFREEVAKEYVSQATLEKFEARILTAIDRLGDRLDRFVSKE